MIAMILIGLLIVYVLLFTVVGFRTKTWRSRTIGWLALLSPLIWLTWDMPIGYYKFKSLCEREGGLRVYKQPTPATTLRLSKGYDKVNAEALLKAYPKLVLIEARDPGGTYGTYQKFTRGQDGKFVMTPFDEKAQPNFNSEEETTAKYLLKHEEYLQLPFRIGKHRYVLKEPKGDEVVSFTKIYYAWTNPSNTLLGRTASEYCFYDQYPDEELTKLIAN